MTGVTRDLRAAADETHDLVVVGGGIYGVALLLEAARRGQRGLLVERGDFGGATTWNSLRIAHGGLRYLQSLDLHRFGESVAERRWLFASFPDLVEPLRCLMPLYGKGARRPSVLRLALAANDWLSRRRNEGVREDRQLRGGRILDRTETLRRFPLARVEGLKGAAEWHDGSVPDSQRLVIEMLRWACACGARALNHVEARELRVEGGRVRGVEARDGVSGERLELRAPVVVNAAGPWCRSLAARWDRETPRLFHPSLAFNLLLDHEPLGEPAAAVAVAPPVPGARTYFLRPWKGRLMAGTFHAPWNEAVDGPAPGEARIERFLDDLRLAIPGLDVSPEDVLRVHAGLLPATAEGSEEIAVREVILDHGRRGGPRGLFSVSGVKLTTARLVAEKALRAIRGRQLPPWLEGTGRPAPAPPLSIEEIERRLEGDPEGARAEVARLASEESALHLDDLFLRRTDWGDDPERADALVEALGPWPGRDATWLQGERERLRRAIRGAVARTAAPEAAPPR